MDLAIVLFTVLVGVGAIVFAGFAGRPGADPASTQPAADEVTPNSVEATAEPR